MKYRLTITVVGDWMKSETLIGYTKREAMRIARRALDGDNVAWVTLYDVFGKIVLCKGKQA